jgi:hypothetical protein
MNVFLLFWAYQDTRWKTVQLEAITVVASANGAAAAAAAAAAVNGYSNK